MKIQLYVNEKLLQADVDPATPLLWVIRDQLQLYGTKYGCGIGQCGACTVHVDGEATRACLVPVGTVGKRKITTIEGLSAGRSHPVQRAWIAHAVPQCGYCQSGMIMTVAALLKDSPAPSDDEIDEKITNICRCGTYERIRQAIHAAAAEVKNEE